MTNNLKEISPSIYYFLLDWKDRNFEFYKWKFNQRSLDQLSHFEINGLIRHAVETEEFQIANNFKLR